MRRGEAAKVGDFAVEETGGGVGLAARLPAAATATEAAAVEKGQRRIARQEDLLKVARAQLEDAQQQNEAMSDDNDADVADDDDNEQPVGGVAAKKPRHM